MGRPSSSRGRRAPGIRRTLPAREMSLLPPPMESRESTVEVNRIGSAAEIDELEYIVNSEDSHEAKWDDDRLPEGNQLIGTRVRTGL